MIMKAKSYILLVILSACVVRFYAQDNVFKIGLGNLIFKTINLEYEHVLSDEVSFSLNGSIMIPHKGMSYLTDESSTVESYIFLNEVKP